jgi:hypothetical protein
LSYERFIPGGLPANRLPVSGLQKIPISHKVVRFRCVGSEALEQRYLDGAHERENEERRSEVHGFVGGWLMKISQRILAFGRRISGMSNTANAEARPETRLIAHPSCDYASCETAKQMKSTRRNHEPQIHASLRTQQDRGKFYENFTLGLLKSKECVGWHWFKYADNDPTDLRADPSNQDSNKGIVSNRYVAYLPLLDSMKRTNERAYQLIELFDQES